MTTPGSPEVPDPGPSPGGGTGPIPPAVGGAAGGQGGGLNQVGSQQNMIGVLSVLFGVITLCCGPCLGFGGRGGTFLFDILPAIIAIATGVVHLRRIKQGRATNRNLAVIGIALGVVGLVLAVCLASTDTGSSLHNDIT